MYHALYVFTLLFIELFSHLPRTIEGYSLWINSYTNKYGICMECYITMARSKGGCRDLKGIAREFFNATRVVEYRISLCQTSSSANDHMRMQSMSIRVTYSSRSFLFCRTVM